MSLGKNIASRRKSQNFSQEDIATLVGVSRQAVSKWEKEVAARRQQAETEKTGACTVYQTVDICGF